MNALAELDGIVKQSLESFHRDLCGMESCGREREIVSLYTFGHLVKSCRPGNVLYDTGQIGIEVAVRQLERCEAYPNVGKTVCKDLVIWPVPNRILWKADCPWHEPLAVMEWKMVHVFDKAASRRRKPKDYELDIRWLENKVKAIGSDFVGYAVFVDSTCDPRKFTCARVCRDRSEREWLVPSANQT